MSSIYESFEKDQCTSPQTTNPSEIISNNINSLEDNLCDMKVTLAEIKANLLFLAQTLCNQGVLCDIEKSLLLNMDQGLKFLNCKVNESKNNVDCLNHFLR